MPYVQSILTNKPSYIDGGSYVAAADRRPLADIMSPGIVGATDLLPSWTAGMTIRTAPGAAYVQGQNVSYQGNYHCYIPANVDLACTAADATNPRIDTLILRALDTAADSSTFTEGRVEIVPGTPTAGATLVNLNGKANLTTLTDASKSVLLLAYVLVPAGAAALDATKVSDQRVRAYVGGGSLVDPWKIAQRGATDKQGLVWNTTNTRWEAGAAGETLLYDSGYLGSAQASPIDSGAGGFVTTFNHLRIIIKPRSSVAALTDGLRLRFNNDSGANYDQDGEVNGQSYSPPNGQNGFQAGTQFDFFSIVPGATAGATRAGIIIIDVPLYADPTFGKTIIWNGGAVADTVLGNNNNMSFGNGFWRSTAAITRIQASLTTGPNFAAGSRMMVYGRM